MAVNNTTIRELAKIAHSAPSADNSQPWKLIWNGDCLSVSYDTGRVIGKTFPPHSPATLLSIGSVVEILVSVATDWGMGPKLELCENLPTPSGTYATIKFDTIEANNSQSERRHPTLLRHTNRLSYHSQPIPDDLSPDIESQRENHARTVIIRDNMIIRRIASVVRRASEVRFQTQEIHEWLGRSLRFSDSSAKKGDGMDVATLGLPPGGKLFLRLISQWSRMRILNKFGIYKVVAGIDSAPVASAPALVAIIGSADPRGTFDSGRLMTRSWINLNRQGLSVHPYYVIADQLSRKRNNGIPSNLNALADDISKQSTDLFGLRGDETLHMLFRVGYTKNKPRMALRLALDSVYKDTSPRS